MRSDSLVRLGRRRRRHRQRSRLWARLRILLLCMLFASILATVGAVASFAYTYQKVGQNLPELGDYKAVELAQTSVIYDSNGNVVDELHGVQNRFVVSGDQMNPSLRDAAVAIEDHRFYKHHGLDFRSIARAAEIDLLTLSFQEGGSTITQQLIKNTYIDPNQRSIPSFQRKTTEAALAWQYEKKHSKREILTQYLNTVYFGQNAYGAEAAAKTYFNKHAKDLTLSESAMLAGIINLPGLYDPFTDPKSAKERRNVVLDKMYQYGYITKKQHDKAVSEGLHLSRGRIQYANDNEYFLNAVREELAKQYGDEAIYTGGLKVYTTLNPKLQEMATKAVDSVVDPSAGDPSASLVSIDPQTGAVRAMVGGSDFDKVKFNLATQAHRQPGSSFKPFVLAEAIKEGISPETKYVSKNLKIPLPSDSPDPYYYVENYGGAERGPITIKEATEQSDNTVYVQLALDLGLNKVVDMAHALGIKSSLEDYPSTAIGGLGEGVTPLEMASAYSTFANNGTHMTPYLIDRVTTKKDGEEYTVDEHQPEKSEALTRDQAAAVTQVLQGVVEKGTVSYYHNLDAEIGRPSAGKTGTTEEFRDAWYVGYIPQLTTSVWVGYPKKEKSMVNINGLSEINGENYPLDIWSAYMQQAVSQFPTVEQLPVPSSDLKLEKKTNGRAYVPPPPETTQEETTAMESTTSKDNSSEKTTSEKMDQAPKETTSVPTVEPSAEPKVSKQPSAIQPRRARPVQPAPRKQLQPAPRKQKILPAPRRGRNGPGGRRGGVLR